jgi:hypothetical protein
MIHSGAHHLVTPLAWMVGAAVVSWMAVSALLGARVVPEALLGMLGPLASAGVAWVVMQRVHASGPDRLMGVMIKALAVKVVFFGAYVIAMLRVLELRPVPFVVSFASYFIGLHMMEALFLKRLLMDDRRSHNGWRPEERTR